MRCSETPELLEFVKKDTNGKVLFLLMPASAQAVTLNNGGNGAAAGMIVAVDESMVVGIPGDFDNNEQLDVNDVNALIGGIGGADLTFDLTEDNVVDQTDLDNWIKELKVTLREIHQIDDLDCSSSPGMRVK